MGSLEAKARSSGSGTGGIACRHPQAPDRAVTLAGSERTPPRHLPEPALDAELEPFLASLAFTSERPIASSFNRIGPLPVVSSTGPGGIVATGRRGEVVLLGPSDAASLKRFSVGRNPMTAVEAGGALWLVDDLGPDAVVHRVDPSTGRVLGATAAPGAQWIAAGVGAVFASGPSGIHRIPFDGAGATLVRGGSFSGMARLEDALWVSDVGNGNVVRLDPATGAPRGLVVAVGNSPTKLVATREALLVVVRGDAPALVRVDPATGAVAARYPLPSSPTSACLQDGRIWVTLPREGTLRAFDPPTGRIVDELRLAPFPMTMACAEGAIWVTLGASAEGIVRLVP